MTDVRETGLSEDGAREAILQYRAKSKKNQSTIAKELDVSDTALSQFLGGTYPAPHTIIAKIGQLLQINGKRETVPHEPSFKMTKVSKAVYGLINYSHIRRKITVAYGDAGIGKTMAVAEYTRQYPNNTIVIEGDPNFDTIPALYELLAMQMGIAETRSRRIQSEAMRQLKDSNKVIIVDEAQLLTTKQIDALRRFAEKCNVGVAFVGNHAIYTKMIGSGQQPYAQVFSRIGDDSMLLNKHIGMDDIRLIFDDMSLDEESISILHNVSQTNYGLRGAVDVYMNTALRHDGEVNFERLDAFARKKLKR